MRDCTAHQASGGIGTAKGTGEGLADPRHHGTPLEEGENDRGSRDAPGPVAATSHYRLLRVIRGLYRALALGEDPALLVEQAPERIREAGGYRSVHYHVGDGLSLEGTFGGPVQFVLPGEVNCRRHGILLVEADPERPPDAAELLILEDCADDLALAFHLEHIERVRQETIIQILESEERFRQVFHQTNDAVLLFEIDREGGEPVYLEANEQARRWLGYLPDELRERSLPDLIEPTWLPGPPPWEGSGPGSFRFDARVRRRYDLTEASINIHLFNLLGRPVMCRVSDSFHSHNHFCAYPKTRSGGNRSKKTVSGSL